MTRRSIVTDRYARWVDRLWAHGYTAEAHPHLPTSAAAGTVGLRARRLTSLGVPHVVIDVAEIWSEGDDPDGLGLEAHSCHLAGAAWHAQIAEGEEGAERLDVDRDKPAPLKIHRHPLGRPGDDRQSEATLPAPEAWILRVEHLCAELFFEDDEAE